MDLGAIAGKKNFTFPKALALLEPHHDYCVVLYPGESYVAAEKQSVYSISPTNWTNGAQGKNTYIHTYTHTYIHMKLLVLLHSHIHEYGHVQNG